MSVARRAEKNRRHLLAWRGARLQLSVLSLLGPPLGPEHASELFEPCCCKSCDQVEELLAARSQA